PVADWRRKSHAWFSSLVRFQAGPPIFSNQDFDAAPPPALIPAAGNAANGIGNAAVRTLEREDALHLVVGQREIEHVEIVGDALRLRRERNGADALLDEPAQRDLRDVAPALAGDIGEHRIVEQPPTPERA